MALPAASFDGIYRQRNDLFRYTVHGFGIAVIPGRLVELYTDLRVTGEDIIVLRLEVHADHVSSAVDLIFPDPRSSRIVLFTGSLIT